MTDQAEPQNIDATDTLKVATEIIRLLEDKKAENCQLLDVRTKATFCDFFIIASGNVGRQLGAMADHIARFLKSIGLPHNVEGTSGEDWILVDGGDVVIHLFRPEARERYALEKMWSSEA